MTKTRLHTSNAGGLGLILGQGTRFHVPKLRVHMLQLKILDVTTKIKDPGGWQDGEWVGGHGVYLQCVRNTYSDAEDLTEHQLRTGRSPWQPERNMLLLFFGCYVWLIATPWTVAHYAPLPSAISQSLLNFTCIELVMLSNHLILCCPLLLSISTFPSIRAFSNESALRIRWPKYWSFSFSVSPSSEYSGLISFRMD